jgi:probable rRNA maturation factor
MHGDIVISFDTVMRESKIQNKIFENHFTHLVLHGILHLLGYDHIEDSDAEEMEKMEVKILQRLNIGDPYNE